MQRNKKKMLVWLSVALVIVAIMMIVLNNMEKKIRIDVDRFQEQISKIEGEYPLKFRGVNVVMSIAEAELIPRSDRVELKIHCRISGNGIPIIGSLDKSFTLSASAGGIYMTGKEIRLAAVEMPEYRVLGLGISDMIVPLFEGFKIYELSTAEQDAIPSMLKPKGFTSQDGDLYLRVGI